MGVFTLIILALVVLNFLLLIFSCNYNTKASKESSGCSEIDVRSKVNKVIPLNSSARTVVKNKVGTSHI